MTLGILALGIACFGVSLAEGYLVSNFMRAVSRQPELFDKLRPIIFLGIGFIEGTFFVTLGMSLFLK
ncbi:ATP F0F1 synthase subunit C [Streptococcus pacificus]|uniref:ATP synthase F(0) sector subunit c n=1 Tax=Streptococcus pacificus TaxID=2740577 RepID=A0ABS0ZIR7_9STRE|nr:ATP F0F1 synthase subunit C [Streptococcus pacificus]MBJ8325909.1 ATP F0F1 synthase subunit C [Streptococcus pacificus]